MELLNYENYNYFVTNNDNCVSLFEDEREFNSLFNDDLFMYMHNQNPKNVFINDKIKDFIDKYYTYNKKDELIDEYNDDLSEIYEYFDENKYIFPSDFNPL